MRSPSRVPLRFYAKENLLLVRVFAAVDQDLSDRISETVGYPTVKPLKVKPASEAVRFKVNEL